MGWRYEMRRKVERRILAWLLGLVTLLGIPRAGSASDDEGEFILRCSPEAIHEIVRRHGLTLIRSHGDRKSTRLNSSHGYISYAVFCLKKKKKHNKSKQRNNNQMREH